MSTPTPIRFAYPELVGLEHDGAGINVAVIDSGYKGHADIKSRTTFKQSFITGNSDVTDRYGHGNHVSAIIAGTGNKSSDDEFAGVAAGAKLFALRTLDDLGEGSTSDGCRAHLYSPTPSSTPR